ncbi:MAG: TraM recognition domain-containing protein [Betaproteobacteria bacterium]|nr:TraM recognition domain-containing protein [Betaproteobacteria bacterium]
MESMIIGASIAVGLFGLLLWRLLASNSKLHDGSARRIVLSGVVGAATASLLAPASLWPGFAGGAVFGLWLSYKRSISQVQGCAADVMNDAGKMRRLAAPFDPDLFIRTVRKAGRDEIFMGLDQNRKPILVPRTKLGKNHVEILGESGVGKSSLAGVLLTQFAAAGECVIVIDPKADRMLPGVLARAGREYGFPVTNIDLRFGRPPQLNPFLNARRDQVEELLQVALELGKTGSGAVDFYRGKDREATGFMAEAFADGETSMPELLERAAEDERVTVNENLWREFRQIARVPAFNVHQGQGGLDLERLIQHSGVIYVTGSTTRLEVQAGQKLLLQRVMQILDERRDQSRPVTIFLDELKYILSPAALRAAGTIRDRNVHLLFAHQSIGDLSDCPGLDPKVVRGAIWGNSGIKIAYKMLDAETARELSLISGDRAVLETRTTENDDGMSVAQSIGKASHMPAHIFTHLPKPAGEEASVGVVIGDGPAYFLSTRWLKAGPPPEPIPAPPLFTEPAVAVPVETSYAAVDPAPADVGESRTREADFGDLLR